MQIDIVNISGKKVGQADLADAVFATKVKDYLLWELVKAQRAAARAGTHKTKKRDEVRGGGKKPYKQKGTGNARQGSTRSPQFVGGGRVWGPQPRDYSYKMNTKEKKAALKSALSRRVKEGKFVVVNDMSVDEAKTKSFALKMAGIGVEGKALLIDTLENTNAVLAARNNPKLNFVDALHVNVYDVVNSRYIVLSQAALDRLTEALSNER